MLTMLFDFQCSPCMCNVGGLEPAVRLAQLVDHRASVTAVVGSSPAPGTLFPPVLLYMPKLTVVYLGTFISSFM